jgi:hypothetical protein
MPCTLATSVDNTMFSPVFPYFYSIHTHPHLNHLLSCPQISATHALNKSGTRSNKNTSDDVSTTTSLNSSRRYSRLSVRACAVRRSTWKVKDLTFQNGIEDWADLESMMKHFENMKHVENKELIMNFMVGHVSEELVASPLFEVLFGNEPAVNPTATFNTSERPLPGIAPRQAKINFTAKEFITMCKETCCYGSEGPQPENPQANLDRFKISTNALVQEIFNILFFLTTKYTDKLLEDSSFFRMLIHTASAARSNVYIDWSAVYNTLDDFLEDIYIPLYPPSLYGLRFGHAHF